jgi:ATP-dependent Clp protease protease subunit
MFTKVLILLFLLVSFSLHAENVVLNSENTVSLNTEVSDSSVTEVMLQLQKLNNIDTKEPIYLVLNTPGGSVFAGIDFIRYALTSKRPINTITIFAASMGFQIAQALPGKRLMAYSGVLMSHRAAVGGISGQYPGELNVRVDFLQSISDQLDVEVARRSGMTLKQYQNLIHDEYYATPSKAIKDKFADGVAEVRCDSSLDSTYIKEFSTLFGVVNVEFSSCPLITNYLKAEFKKKTNENTNLNASQFVNVGKKIPL